MVDAIENGMPTRPDVEKLNDALDLQVGDLVKHEQISAIIGELKSSNRYRTVVSAWREFHWRESKIQIDAEHHVGYRVLTAAQAATSAVSRMKRVTRANRKLGSRVKGIDTRNMEPAKQQMVSVVARYTDAVNDAYRLARKDIAQPQPVPATTLRLAK